jgi:transcriptional regulator
MYIPLSFRVDDNEQMYDLIEKNSFAILFSQKEGEPSATHLPLLLDKKEGCLYGHMAKANPHWRNIASEVLAVFSGPHTYISPSWYETNESVPTWNYVAVHVYGRVELIEDNNKSEKILNDSVHYYEAAMPNPWCMNKAGPAFIHNLSQGVIGFKITITKMEGKWKLSQNHSKQRQARVIEALEGQVDDNSKQIAALMKMNVENS